MDNLFYYKKILRKLFLQTFKELLKYTDKNELDTFIDKLISDIFNNEDEIGEKIKKQAMLLCDSLLKKEHFEAKLLTRKVPIRIVPILMDISEKKKIGIIPINITKIEFINYQNTKLPMIDIIYLSGFDVNISISLVEALALSGVEKELDYNLLKFFDENLKNNMIKFKIDDDNVYKNILKNIEKLPLDMKFTLFNNKKDKEVYFFNKTIEVKTKNKIKGPYLTSKIMSLILAASLIEGNEDKEYLEYIEKRKKYEENLKKMFFEENEEFYFILDDDNNYIKINTNEINYDDYLKIINEYNYIIPITRNELDRLLNHELDLKKDNLELIKENPFKDKYEKNFKEKDYSEKIIEMLISKREQLLLASTDFNENNLTYLADYIYGSVQEFIVREDIESGNNQDKYNLYEREEFNTMMEKLSKYQFKKSEFNILIHKDIDDMIIKSDREDYVR